MSDEYVSYKSPSTIVAETVYHFLRGGIYGAAFGLVSSDPPSLLIQAQNHRWLLTLALLTVS
jgi:hypothetical protein